MVDRYVNGLHLSRCFIMSLLEDHFPVFALDVIRPSQSFLRSFAVCSESIDVYLAEIVR